MRETSQKTPLFISIIYHLYIFFHFCVYPRFIEHATQRSKMECFGHVDGSKRDSENFVKTEQIQVGEGHGFQKFSKFSPRKGELICRWLVFPFPILANQNHSRFIIHTIQNPLSVFVFPTFHPLFFTESNLPGSHVCCLGLLLVCS